VLKLTDSVRNDAALCGEVEPMSASSMPCTGRQAVIELALANSNDKATEMIATSVNPLMEKITADVIAVRNKLDKEIKGRLRRPDAQTYAT